MIFQADFAAGESKTFTVSVGDKWVYTKDRFRAYGRFVRERFDDFCWENDRIAHRMYGKALETYFREMLVSSTVDIWSKRTPRMVINDWYMVDNYHADTGEGGDLYSAGPAAGAAVMVCGQQTDCGFPRTSWIPASWPTDRSAYCLS